MPRLSEVSRAQPLPSIVETMYQRLFGDRDPVAEPGTATGTPGDWWTVMALSPDVMEYFVDGGTLYHGKSSLPATLRELAQTRAGWARGSKFVFSQHCKSCRSLGMSEEKIQAIAYWEVSDQFSAEERTVLAYTDALVLNGGRVADGVFNELKKYLDDKTIFELSYITGLYDFYATLSKALRLEYDNEPDHVVEVAAPEGNQARDIGADISR